MINQVRGGLGHASAVARGAHAPAFAREVHEKIVSAGTAPCSGKPETEDAAAEIAPQFCLDVGRHRLVPEAPLGKPGLDVAGDEPVKRCLLRVAAGVLFRLAVRRAGL